MTNQTVAPVELEKDEVERALYDRCREMNLDPDDVIYSLCWGDVLGVIAELLCERGLAPETLDNAGLQAMFDKTKDYIEGEGMPSRKDIGTMWHEVISLGVRDAWPAGLKLGSDEPEEG